MTVPWFRSILSRVVLLHVLAIAITAVVTPLVLLWMLSAETNNLHQRLMTDEVMRVSRRLSEGPDGSLAIRNTPGFGAQYSADYGRYAYAVLDRDGNVLLSSRKDGRAVFPFQQLTEQLTFEDVSRNDGLTSGATLHQDINGHEIWIQVGEDMAHRDVLIDDIVGNFIFRVGWIVLPIFLLLFAADVVIFRGAIRPLLRASSKAAEIGPSRTEIRLPEQNIPREIWPLVRAVNQALDRLEAGFQVQRAFTADAAHELRTPLAVLRARIETIDDSAQVAVLRKDVDEMSRVVAQLLELAEVDSSPIDRGTRVDLAVVCAEVAEFIAPLAVASEREIAVIAPERPVEIEGNAELLRRAVRNLVENALAHTRKASTVEIRIDENATIAVLDEGPGIAEEQRDKVFDRFWRAERSRGGGAGLGLSIVKRIVEAHNGRVWVDNRKTGGAAFFMRFAQPAALL